MTNKSNRQIWGIAKSPELQLTGDELHLIICRITGKTSLKELSSKETHRVINELINMRDKHGRGKRAAKRERGKTSTENQRKKIFKLMQDLEWNESRINGMCKRMFKVSAVEWLDYAQCSNLIEALKAMLDRKEQGDGAEAKENDPERDKVSQGS